MRAGGPFMFAAQASTPRPSYQKRGAPVHSSAGVARLAERAPFPFPRSPTARGAQ